MASIRFRMLRLLEGRLAEPSQETASDEGYHYHATNIENARSIAHQGLRPRRPWHGTDQREWPDGTTERRVYFNPKAHHVWSFAPEEGRPVILRVHGSKAKIRSERSTGDTYSRERVPSKHIETLTTDGKWVSVRKLRKRRSE